jgi:hypothetical protein
MVFSCCRYSEGAFYSKIVALILVLPVDPQLLTSQFSHRIRRSIRRKPDLIRVLTISRIRLRSDLISGLLFDFWYHPVQLRDPNTTKRLTPEVQCGLQYASLETHLPQSRGGFSQVQCKCNRAPPWAASASWRTSFEFSRARKLWFKNVKTLG